MEKIGYDTLAKMLYRHAIGKLQITLIPALNYVMVDGQGDPNANPEFKRAVDALFLVSHAIKALPKKGAVPDGYFEYHVNVLEGLWDVPEGESFDIARREKLLWTLMIMQPSFVTPELFSGVLAQLRIEKADNMALKRMRFETLDEGLCCQATHFGPYTAEPATFERMMRFTEENGYERVQTGHHEVYVSDYRRNAPENLKTLVRFKVRKRQFTDT